MAYIMKATSYRDSIILEAPSRQQRGAVRRHHFQIQRAGCPIISHQQLVVAPLFCLLALLFQADTTTCFRPNTVSPTFGRNPLRVATPTSSTRLSEAPKGALSDIVIPSVFPFPGQQQQQQAEEEDDVDPRVWVPQTDCLDFRPLCFCVSQGYYVNLLRFKGGGVLGCHRHPSPVHALTLKGSWGYREHDWHATAGTYIFEPPGETHTLIVDDDCDEMIAMFHVTGALIYVDPTTQQVTGYDDVFTKLEKARAWYKECGLGEEYAEQFVR